MNHKSLAHPQQHKHEEFENSPPPVEHVEVSANLGGSKGSVFISHEKENLQNKKNKNAMRKLNWGESGALGTTKTINRPQKMRLRYVYIGRCKHYFHPLVADTRNGRREGIITSAVFLIHLTSNLDPCRFVADSSQNWLDYTSFGFLRLIPVSNHIK